MAVYVPVVKSKSNDLDAISRLQATSVGLIKPLLESPIAIENKVAVTDVAKAASEVSSRLPQIPHYFDPLNFEAEFRQLSAVQKLAAEGRSTTPTFGLHRLPKDKEGIATILHKFGLSLGIRVDLRDLHEVPEETWEALITYSGQVGLSPNRIELLLDLQHIEAHREEQITEAVLDFLLIEPKGFVPGVITVIGSSALASVADVTVNGERSVLRTERNVWAKLNYELDGTRAIQFGDYGVVNPRFAFSGPNPNANAKIRYATGAEHRVFRGHGLYKPNRFDQYFDLAKRVVDSAVFMGRDFSFGDDYISACAEREVGPGNLGTWVKVDTNHHIEVVSRQTDLIMNSLSNVASATDLKELLVEV